MRKKYINISLKIVKLLEVYMGKTFLDIGFGNDLLNITHTHTHTHRHTHTQKKKKQEKAKI